jgi:hypothetical protein
MAPTAERVGSPHRTETNVIAMIGPGRGTWPPRRAVELLGQHRQGCHGMGGASLTETLIGAAAPKAAPAEHRATARWVLRSLVHVITPRVVSPFRGLTGMTGDGSEPSVPQRALPQKG